MTESRLTDSIYEDTHLSHNLEENYFDGPYEAPFEYDTSILRWNIGPLFPPPLKHIQGVHKHPAREIEMTHLLTSPRCDDPGPTTSYVSHFV